MAEIIQQKLPLPKWIGSQRRIGITGGIASGKSSAEKILKQKGLPILDADIYSKEALAPGSIATKQTIERYGEIVTQVTKANIVEINRKALAEIIFNNKNEKQWLENLLHPIVKKKILNELARLKKVPAVILVIPLLFEVKLSFLCSETWLIYCDLDNQYERLKKRNNLNYSQAKQRIESQLPMDYKKELADVVVYNNGDLANLKKQIDKLI